MGIINNLKSLFGKSGKEKENTEATPFEQSPDKDAGDKEAEALRNYFTLSFLHGEAEYRNQMQIIPRLELGEELKLKDLFKFVYGKELVNYFAGLSICRTNQFGGTDEVKFLEDVTEACNYNILSAVSYINKEGRLYPQTGENATLTLSLVNGQKFILFVRNMYTTPDIHYLRVYFMQDNSYDNDDLRSDHSQNFARITNITLAVRASDNNIDELLDFFDENKKKLDENIQRGEIGDDYQKAIFEGFTRRSPTECLVDDSHALQEKEQYYDAQVKYDRLLRSLNKPNDNMEVSNQYSEINYRMFQCLVGTNDVERSFYYFNVASYFNDNISGFFIHIAASICDFRAHEYIESAKKNISKEELGIVEGAYKNNKERLIEETHNEPNVLTVGFILHTLLRANKENVLSMVICRYVDGKYRYEQVNNQNELWLYPASKLLFDGNTIVFRYSRASYQCGIKDDKSVRCHDNSIIMQVTRIAGTEKMRVDVMVPVFVDDPDNFENVPNGCADYKSFIVSTNPHEFDFSRPLDEIYKEASGLCSSKEYCVIEGMVGLFHVYNSLLIVFDSLTDYARSMFFDTAAKIGSGFMEFGMYDIAFYYLNVGENSYITNNMMEYVNSVVNMKSVLSKPIIDSFLKNDYKFENQSDKDKWDSFLKRRKAYVLIDWGQIEEAKKCLKELLNDPQCEDFAIGELAYIEKLEKQQNNEQ